MGTTKALKDIPLTVELVNIMLRGIGLIDTKNVLLKWAVDKSIDIMLTAELQILGGFKNLTNPIKLHMPAVVLSSCTGAGQGDWSNSMTL